MKAFITGINGQDGSYLAEYLIAKNYEVHGTVRRSSSINTKKIDHLISTHQGKNLYLYYSDLLDSSSLTNLISKIEPNEIYNLAAQSHVAVSFQNPLFTTETSTVGPLSLLESIRNVNKEIKFYQASSSEMYGGSLREPLDENSKLIQKIHTLLQKYLHLKFLKYTENLMICLQLMGSYLTMSLLEEEKRLLLEKFQKQ